MLLKIYMSVCSPTPWLSESENCKHNKSYLLLLLFFPLFFGWHFKKLLLFYTKLLFSLIFPLVFRIVVAGYLLLLVTGTTTTTVSDLQAGSFICVKWRKIFCLFDHLAVMAKGHEEHISMDIHTHKQIYKYRYV